MHFGLGRRGKPREGFSSHPGICRRAVLPCSHLCSQTGKGFECLLGVPLDKELPGGRVRVTAFRRLSQGGLTPKAQRGKGQPSACGRRSHTGMLRCTQEDQQAWPNPVPTASSSYFQMRAGSQGGPHASHPTPPSLPVCSFLSWGDFISSFSWQQLRGSFTLPTNSSCQQGSRCFVHLETISFAGRHCGTNLSSWLAVSAEELSSCMLQGHGSA